jgi:hypothetical protein
VTGARPIGEAAQVSRDHISAWRCELTGPAAGGRPAGADVSSSSSAPAAAAVQWGRSMASTGAQRWAPGVAAAVTATIHRRVTPMDSPRGN